ncbi:hypothetical protein [Streptomyces sp. NPDC004284]|uniref:hypothetical protein n=1 Tax=Streptomyces sp. NPDC004284 TaxID=3364695 RepID=UPI003680CCF6
MAGWADVTRLHDGDGRSGEYRAALRRRWQVAQISQGARAHRRQQEQAHAGAGAERVESGGGRETEDGRTAGGACRGEGPDAGPEAAGAGWYDGVRVDAGEDAGDPDRSEAEGAPPGGEDGGAQGGRRGVRVDAGAFTVFAYLTTQVRVVRADIPGRTIRTTRW